MVAALSLVWVLELSCFNRLFVRMRRRTNGLLRNPPLRRRRLRRIRRGLRTIQALLSFGLLVFFSLRRMSRRNLDDWSSRGDKERTVVVGRGHQGLGVSVRRKSREVRKRRWERSAWDSVEIGPYSVFLRGFFRQIGVHFY